MARPSVDSKAETESLLLVEGLNDCHAVFQLMWLLYQTDPVFGIHECGGDEKVLDSLSSRVIEPEPRQKILGVVLDSDIEDVAPAEMVQTRLKQLRGRLDRYYEFPDEFPADGLILEPKAGRIELRNLPIVGVWLMPNNQASGMFEDLLSASLADEARKYTTDVVLKAKEDAIATYRDTHLSKAIIRTFMAWQDPPDIQYLGLAIKKGTFENLETKCASFASWLDRLFGEPASNP
jgi:hypothetical protein